MKGAELPDAAWTMLQTRRLNDWLGSSYSLEEVAEMDWLTFWLLDKLDGATKKGK